MVDPKKDESWKTLKPQLKTDEVHAKDRLNPSIETPGIVFKDSFSRPHQQWATSLCSCFVLRVEMITIHYFVMNR